VKPFAPVAVMMMGVVAKALFRAVSLAAPKVEARSDCRTL
jgi:hypothetical protein